MRMRAVEAVGAVGPARDDSYFAIEAIGATVVDPAGYDAGIDPDDHRHEPHATGTANSAQG
jgi:hypothetical protein